MLRKETIEPQDELNESSIFSKKKNSEQVNKTINEDSLNTEKKDKVVNEKESNDQKASSNENLEVTNTLNDEIDNLSQNKKLLIKEIEDLKNEKAKLIENFRQEAILSLNEEKNKNIKLREETLKAISENNIKLTEIAEKEKICDSLITKANEVARRITSDADIHIKGLHEQVNKIKKDNEELVNRQLNDIKKIQMELNDKKIDLAQKEADINSKIEDAKNGFQKEFIKEREKFDLELSKLKEEISFKRQELLNEKVKIDDEISKYRKEQFNKIDNEIADEKKKLEARSNSLDEREATISKQESQLKTKELRNEAEYEAYKTRSENIPNDVENQVNVRYTDLINQISSLKSRLSELDGEKKNLNNRVIELQKKLDTTNGEEVSKLKADIKEREERLEAIKNDRESIISTLNKYRITPENLADIKYRLDNFNELDEKYMSLLEAYKALESDYQEAKQSADIVKKYKNQSESYKSLYDEAKAQIEEAKNPSRKDRMSSLTDFNGFEDILSKRATSLDEGKWLVSISEGMEKSGIKISKRLLYAFHTSVKIHDWSPLVVLAGVSGTGKSELPRQYAEHGGLKFIPVPVKPDWDSMQSLFGYYNSIENKFEPTELCKALYQLQSNSDLSDTMALVLLDEMNLAYVELYFSDLLSKFETNRGINDDVNYEIALGAKEKPEKMKIGKNILWVGTMNEDETTKALSDKVIDRSTLITFPRPEKLVSRDKDVIIEPSKTRLSYKKWQGWCQNTLTEEQVNQKFPRLIDQCKSIVEEINMKMSLVNRNLGHRVWQSIERYCFAHPKTNETFNIGNFEKTFKSVFSEAVAFKIMPKLRGIEVSGESKRVLDDIQSIINTSIPELTADFDHARSLSSRIFQWSSAKFMEKDE